MSSTADVEFTLFGVIIGALITFLATMIQTLVSARQYENALAKPAMRDLYNLLSNREMEPDKWSEAVLKFLNTFEAGFIPEKIQKKVVKFLDDLDDKYTSTYPEKRQKFSDEDAKQAVKDWDKEYSAMSPKEKAEVDFRGWFLQRKRELRAEVSQAISGQKMED